MSSFAFVVCLVAMSIARADAPLRLERTLAREALGAHSALLVDETGRLSLDDVREATMAARFAPGTNAMGERNYGYSDAAFWLRIPVENPTDTERRWLLELANPHADDVTLYVPRADGRYAAHATGDHADLGTRDLSHTSFVFTLREPAHGLQTYYLRVTSQGPIHLPLVAWSAPAFMAHQDLEWLGYSLFYGALVLMTAASLCVFLFGVEREAGVYCLYLASTFLCVFTLSGHTQQFLVPEQPGLAQRLLPLSIALPFVCALLVMRSETKALSAPGVRRLRWGQWCLYGVSACTLVLSYRASIVLVTTTVLAVVPFALYAGVVAAREGSREARLLVTAFAFPLLGGLVHLAQRFGVIESEDVGRWSVPIGVSIQVVLISTTFADRINSARRELHRVNVVLHAQVEAVSSALSTARSAMQAAERDTALRDQFIGTMSHEFLTPLNAIINIPEGIACQFQPKAVVACSVCEAVFALDPDETFDPESPCLDCHAKGALRAREQLGYAGDVANMRHLLLRLERSGQGLLRTVNGILDFSKLQAGQFKLARERVQVADVLALALQTFRAQCGEELTHTLRIAPVDAALSVHADAQCVHDVLVHLLDNAVKFSAPGSAVELGARDVGGVSVLSVRDQGIGIAAHDTERIFHGFEQVSRGLGRNYGGTGLGLTICAALVKAHGGRMWVESQLGHGSTFHFALASSARPSVHVAPQRESRAG